jgi:DNA-binding response OmpR family regulator
VARILAVDDDLSVLTLIRNALQTEGHTVTVCSDSAEVLKMDLNRYQLILLDIMMPGMDGFELCCEIRHWVDCPILFLTAKTREADIVRGLGYGADDYLTKPFGIAELRARVDAHLRRDQRKKQHSVVVGTVRLSLRSKECFVGSEKVPFTRSETFLFSRMSSAEIPTCKNNGKHSCSASRFQRTPNQALISSWPVYLAS